MEYISALDAARKWGISKRRVQILCIEDRIAGVKKVGNMWLIPEDAEKPKDGRTKGQKNEQFEEDGMTKEEFNAEMLRLNEELKVLNKSAQELERKIAENLLSLVKG